MLQALSSHQVVIWFRIYIIVELIICKKRKEKKRKQPTGYRQQQSIKFNTTKQRPEDNQIEINEKKK